MESQGSKGIVCCFSLEKLKKECCLSEQELQTFCTSSKVWKYEDKQKLLDILSELILDSTKAPCIAQEFSGILLEILTRTKNLVEHSTTEDRRLIHLRFSVTLSHLLKHNLHIVPFTLEYLKQFGPFFHEDTARTNGDRELVISTAYRFLSFSPALFCNMWDWSVLCEEAYATGTHMQKHLSKMLSIILKLSDKEKLVLQNGVVDQENIVRLFESTNDFNHGSQHGNSTKQLNKLTFYEEELHGKFTISTHILLPKGSTVCDEGTELVQVPSTLRNIEALSIALLSEKAILLEGPIGSGKTSLVEHFCALTGRTEAPSFAKVQLGDQTDSKALIGSYCCTEVPGEFVWRAGILTCAVKQGYWLLLEDIDCAPMDVVSVLIPLLESRILSIPGKGNIMAAPQFKLFATQRSLGHGVFKGFSSNSSFLDHLWSKVHIAPLKKDELQTVIETRFPKLQSICNKLVDVFALVSADVNIVSESDTRHPSITSNKRQATVRDLMKWCTRINALCPTTDSTASQLSAQDVFMEALDCFCATFESHEDRVTVAVAIGAKLNINGEKVRFVCDKYKPQVHVDSHSFTVGRITLNRDQSMDDGSLGHVHFAFTRHSLCLLESISVCVEQNEPTLLVGETGTGKTSAIQYMTSLCGRKLTVVNMSQQSDSTDLIGGFKPMEMKQLVAPWREEFERLFNASFSRKQNVAFLTHIQQCFAKAKWEVLFKLMLHSQGAALNKIDKDKNRDQELSSRWKQFGQRVHHLREQQKQSESSLAFSFVEGALVRAIRHGDWVLLDEINLAAPETLECLNSILESSQGSVVVLERGDAEPVIRHKDFRMFACMNPANDVGKKALPAGIRNRFTEIFVNELQDEGDLKTLVVDYLRRLSPTAALVSGIVSFYKEMQRMAEEKLTDGTGNRPYYSLRTLCRGLKYVSRNPHGSILRSVYEGFCISFLTQLDRSSHNVVQTKLQDKLLGHVNSSSLLNQPLPKPSEECRSFQGYWIQLGNMELFESPEYVFTVSVKENLRDLARVVSGRYFPVLIQGETSVGKTSLINWLAKASGNQCVRINNHEHTDIQEYLGCYTSDSNGKLIFKEGILVDAMRKGYWIILDELNLAPTDVLEALNRLLDDNRELFIPEIQETVKAHPQFMLFATQNPPGQYGGRKILSRAFRNRFVELHFEELPSVELETILHKRCNLPRSYSKKLVNVMLELQARRRGSGVFAGKQGFITLRDLFRWAERYNKTPSHDGTFVDWDQQIAEDGYCLLAGRCRNQQESAVVQEVIEKHLKRKIDVDRLFGLPSANQLSDSSQRILHQVLNNRPPGYDHVVFTFNMRRLAVLVARALEFQEPVLLVGETGCGKTTICQLFSALQNRKLYSVNCHLHTETSDFLGGLRPVRKHSAQEKEGVLKLFEWCDGPLVNAMKQGDMFLADEISLADDSVLERLNSVLEPERTLVLAEKGSEESDLGQEASIDHITAKGGFQLVATMNPGGDYGKKELSPALRNRFTEIWCPALDNMEDMIAIIEHNITPGLTMEPENSGSSGIGKAMVEFVDWFKKRSFGKRCTVSIRDYLSWVQFINVCWRHSGKARLDAGQSYLHGAFLVFIDALGLRMSTMEGEAIRNSRQLCYEFLRRQIYKETEIPDLFLKLEDREQGMEAEREDGDLFTISGFSIARGPHHCATGLRQYALDAPTTAQNAARVVRALQLHRPILLEGSPGVGKTSLVSALAKAAGYKLIRINLSEQTDISDLFGADLPTEGGQGCSFAWCDGPLLQALKSGHWIVLDELNLASQAVLEGLNACFDHRGEIFIPELGMTFQVQHDKTRFFACQNPLSQGGGRKGLPKSFLNRFTQVYIEPLSNEDLNFIAETLYDVIDQDILHKMICFNSQIHAMCASGSGKHSSSWEFNLRDIFRWCDLMLRYQGVGSWNPVSFVQLIYAGRMRTSREQEQVWQLGLSIFGENAVKDVPPLIHVTPSHVQVGRCIVEKRYIQDDKGFVYERRFLLHCCLKHLESLLTCLQMNWMAIVIGAKSCGKTSLVKMAAELTGRKLDVMAMNSSTDTTELLGGYEQVDLRRPWNELKEDFRTEVLHVARYLVLSKNMSDVLSDVGRLLHFLSKLAEESKPSQHLANPLDEIEPAPMMDALTMLKNSINDVASICCKYDISQTVFNKLNARCDDLCVRLRNCNGNPHVSGKFEWVDGQLVQALKKGYWLLIDNVNFCSPSVLDRLNGLLEPGGVLSMNERGVVDGEIPVVKPHSDFRLILAMDTKYGEISRAMRNRGVEIFMSQDTEGISDQHDFYGILQAAGCCNTEAASALENFHKMHAVEGSVLKLAHVASLLTKLMERGAELNDAFQKSVRHVYGEVLVPFVDDSAYDLNNYCTDSQHETPIQLASATLFQQDSTTAIIQHHANPLIKFSRLPGVSQAEMDISMQLFLEWASQHDWQLRLQWLRTYITSTKYKLVGSVDEYVFKETLSSDLWKNICVVYEKLNEKSPELQLQPMFQPFNIEVNGPLYDYILCKMNDDTEIINLLIALTNRIFLLGLYLKFEAMLKSTCDELSPKNYFSSPLKMSIAFSKGLIKLENLPHPGVTHLYPFCRVFSNFVRYLLESNDSVSFGDENTYKIWTSLRHCRRFLDVCLFKPPDDLQTSFGLYWKLLKDETLRNISEVVKDGSQPHDVPAELTSVIGCLDDAFMFDNKQAQRHWEFITRFGHPTTFVTGNVCIMWQKVVKLFHELLAITTSMTVADRVPSLDQRRNYQMILVNNMASLIKLRESKARIEHVQEGLDAIAASVDMIERAIAGNEAMDESSFDAGVIEKMSEIALQCDESPTENKEGGLTASELLHCDVLQRLTAMVANYSFLDCLASVKHHALCEKLNLKDTSKHDWQMAVTFYHKYRATCVKEVTLSSSVLSYLLPEPTESNGLLEMNGSILELTDLCTLHMYTERETVTRLPHDDSEGEQCLHLFRSLGVTSDQGVSSIATNCAPQIALADVGKKVAQFNNLAKYLWMNNNYIENMDVISSNTGWKLLKIAFIRFLHSTSSPVVEDYANIKEIFTTLLLPRNRSMFDASHLWSAFNGICDDIVNGYRTACSPSDIHVLEDCFKRLLSSLRKCSEEEPQTFLEENEPADNDLFAVSRGFSWVYLGFLQLTVFRPVGNVDPVEEANVRISHMKQEIDDVENELKVRKKTEQFLTGVSCNKDYEERNIFTQANPSYVRRLIRHRNAMKESLKQSGSEITYRPFPPKFRQIVDEIQHFSASVGSYSAVQEHLTTFQKLTVYLSEHSTGEEQWYMKTQSLLVRLKMWARSVQKFLTQLKEHVAYEDILGPYVVGLTQILHGVELVVGGAEKLLKKHAFEIKKNKLQFGEVCSPDVMLQCILPFSSTLRSTFERSASLLDKKTINCVEVLCALNDRPAEDCSGVVALLTSRIRKQALSLLESSVRSRGYSKPQDIALLKQTITCYMNLWLEFEERRMLKEQEEGSLYKFKTKVVELDESDEEREKKEVSELFTNFDEYYSDTVTETDDKQARAESDSFEIAEEDVTHLCSVHRLVVSCLPSVSQVLSTLHQETLLQNEKVTHLRTMVAGYNLATDLVSCGTWSEEDLIGCTSQSSLFMSSLLTKALSSSSGEESNEYYSTLFGSRRQNYDVYHDCNLKEVSQVTPVLNRFLARVKELLNEWPEHPTLVHLSKTITRIVSFPVTSSVMKILSGLEILLMQTQDWEANASRHVSMRTHLDEITQIIIRWRKMELSFWSSLLDVCEERASEKANRWWFHIYHVLHQSSTNENVDEIKEFTRILKEFMESSPLGEFSQRLTMLRSFYAQVCIDDVQRKNSEVIKTVLWNVHCYYKQFEPDTKNLILKTRTPIEKELKGFVKIAKWKDINFWAMKQAAAKSHYTLLKLMKKYQAALDEPVDKLLATSPSHGSSFKNKKDDVTDHHIVLANYLAPLYMKGYLEETSIPLSSLENLSFQVTSQKLFVKMRKHTEKALGAMNYEKWSAALDGFTGDVISAAQVLQQLEIGDKVGKKRTEFRKHMQTQKKRGLADLFKALSKLGLSYRKGVILAQQDSVKDPMLVECDDIASKLKNGDRLLDNQKHPVSPTILALLEDCKAYYQKSVTRSAILQNVLPSPSKELTLGDVKRIQGFSEQLRSMTQRQRENLTNVGRLFSDLRLMYMQFEKIFTELPSQPCVFPPQRSIAQWMVKCDDVVHTSLQATKELLLWLEACPDTKVDQQITPVPQRLSQLMRSCKQDLVYLEANAILCFCVDELSRIKATLHLPLLKVHSIATETESESTIFLVTWSHFHCLRSSFNKLGTVLQKLQQLVNLDSRDNGLGRMAFRLNEEIIRTCNEFVEWEQKLLNSDLNKTPMLTEHFNLPPVKEDLLLTFQTWVKQREKISAKYSATENDDADNADFTEDLVNNLDGDLTQDTETLNLVETTSGLKCVVKTLRDFLDRYYENNEDTANVVEKTVRELVPCLCQYVRLVEYYLLQLLLCHRTTCKLHSVLLGIFLELLQKGFCLPPDEEEGEGDGGTTFENSEDCGIGEGEGMKDVSDKIEDEEQLLGAKSENSKEEEAKDEFVEEEEHGIEMTDDFDAEACDLDEEEEQEGSDEEEAEENEVDEQMGENDGDSKLDERIWGDSEDEHDEASDETEERGVGAGAKDESDLVAKEENEGATEGSEDNKDKAKENESQNEEEDVHELSKDLDNQGNLDDDKNNKDNDDRRNETEDENEPVQPEEMELGEDLNLDAESDQENDESKEDTNAVDKDDNDGDQGDDGDQNDQDNNNEGDQDDVDDGTDGSRDKEEQIEEATDMSAEEDLSEWKTDSQSQGGQTEAMEESGAADQSVGATASSVQPEESNEEQQDEGESDGVGRTVSQQGDENDQDITSTVTSSHSTSETTSHRKQLNKSRAERSLGSSDETVQKRAKVVDSSVSTNDSTEKQTKSESDLVEHVKGESERYDSQVYDAATLEQQKQQTHSGHDGDDDPMEEEWDPIEEDRKHEPEINEVNPEVRGVMSETKLPSSNKLQDEDSELAGIDGGDIEEDVTSTSSDQDDKPEQMESRLFIGDTTLVSDEVATPLDAEKCRCELEAQLSRWREQREGTGAKQREAQEAWHKYEMLTSLHAQYLCEQLRIVMEPSIANKLKGDYRTGKRLNMRKVIPYIASQFRKDKIWLRRTKRSKRQYQIMLAVDDSSSMADNHSKQLAFEALAVITTAITRLEAGDIAVCSFGEDVELIHPFHEPFSDQSGANILQRFTFEQKKTKIALLVDTCTRILMSARMQQGTTSRLDTSQLLLIVSDGRGIFLEGVETVQRVVRKAKEAGIFIVFVILDKSSNKDSVLDIKVPVFRPGALPQLTPYIEQFPFPYYIILRDISALPETLSDSLRQWFELVTNK